MNNRELQPAVTPNREYKDSLFRFLFGNEKHREWTLSLFNALSGKEYTDPEEIRYRNMEDVLYIKVKEDVVFLYGSTMNFYEHQSAWSPNLPFRMLEYAAKQFSDIARELRRAVYSGQRVTFPKPKFFVLYNGTDRDVPAETTLKLSGSYDTINRSDELGEAYDLEVIVHVININSGINEALQEKCRPLKEYTWIISSVRQEKDSGQTLNDAIRTVIRNIPDDFVIREEILTERERVTGMLFDEEWNAEQLEKLKAEYREDGLKEGIEKNKAEIAQKMLLKGYPDTEITGLVDVTPEYVAALRDELSGQNVS